MINDDLHVVHARAAGLDVHKMVVTATVRLCVGSGEPVCESRGFSALPRGLDDLVNWLVSHGCRGGGDGGHRGLLADAMGEADRRRDQGGAAECSPCQTAQGPQNGC